MGLLHGGRLHGQLVGNLRRDWKRPFSLSRALDLWQSQIQSLGTGPGPLDLPDLHGLHTQVPRSAQAEEIRHLGEGHTYTLTMQSCKYIHSRSSRGGAHGC